MSVEDQRHNTGAHRPATAPADFEDGDAERADIAEAEWVDAGELDSAQLDRICLFNLLSASTDTIYFKDLASRFIRVSQSQADLAGADSPAAMLGRTDLDYFSREHAAEAYTYEQRIIRTGEPMIDLLERNISVDGRDMALSATKQPLRDFSGRIIGTFGITRDITARQHTERELLAKTEELDRIGRELRTLLDSSPDPMVRMDRELRYTYVNPAAVALSGVPAAEMLGHSSGELGFPADYVREWEAVLRRALATGARLDVERNLLLAGTRRFLRSRVVPEFDETGAVVSLLVVSHDLTDRKRIEDALAEQAVHDPLTRLANRVLLVDRIDRALVRMRGTEDRLAVLFLDLDRFKVVNDSLGHAAGDALLVAVAARLLAAARRTDVVARFGGDEFAVLAEHLSGREDAAVLADRINRALAEPFQHAGQEIHVSASIGIATAGGRIATGAARKDSAIEQAALDEPALDEAGLDEPVPEKAGSADPATSDTTTSDTSIQPAIDAESLLRDADAAMYQVKARNRGAGGYLFFTDTVREQAVSRLEIETQLRLALERGEFRLVYEPVYALRERRLVGVEALIRWQHPERGLLAPAEFIEVAEDCGLIVPMGGWVLEDACRRLARWNRRYSRADVPAGAKRKPSPTMAVNVSVRQISDPAFVGEVAEVLHRYRLDPLQLCMEITETAVHDAPFSAGTVLKGLSALGIQIALDDFGTGYSSLRHLRQVPVDILKIDRMFVNDLKQTGEDRAIVAAVIGMARALGMVTIGEGIETAEQYDSLCELGCDLGQGYLLSQPLAPEEFEAAYLTPSGWRSRPAH